MLRQLGPGQVRTRLSPCSIVTREERSGRSRVSSPSKLRVRHLKTEPLSMALCKNSWNGVSGATRACARKSDITALRSWSLSPSAVRDVEKSSEPLTPGRPGRGKRSRFQRPSAERKSYEKKTPRGHISPRSMKRYVKGINDIGTLRVKDEAVIHTGIPADTDTPAPQTTSIFLLVAIPSITRAAGVTPQTSFRLMKTFMFDMCLLSCKVTKVDAGGSG